MTTISEFIFPPRMSNLVWVNIRGNRLSHLELTPWLTKLEWVGLQYNQITEMTVPEELSSLRVLSFGYNPLERLNVPQYLADGLLYWYLLDLRAEGITTITTYPHEPALISAHSKSSGALESILPGPPGVYKI